MSGRRYGSSMLGKNLDFGSLGFVPKLADTIREARVLIGWSQRELADHAGTSQSTICRFESGRWAHVDLLVVERVLAVLGFRVSLQLDGRHLADRRRQLDAMHARLTGYIARRLERQGWVTALEVAIGDGVPRGWIDLLGYRAADRALLVEETKTDLPDMGGLQRSVAFYEREAVAAAQRLGWRPARVAVMVVALDTDAVARRLAENRDVVTRAFPGRVPDIAAWLRDPTRDRPRGWTLAMADPAVRGASWLQPTLLGSRRRPAAYLSYADAAARLLRR
jgi:transcriptional regulator with XRE-family HTH domain